MDFLLYLYTMLGLVCASAFLYAVKKHHRALGLWENLVILCVITYLWPVVVLLLAVCDNPLSTGEPVMKEKQSGEFSSY